MQIFGIAIVLASLAFGQTTINSSAAVYTPSAQVAFVGVWVTLLGAFIDPVIERWLKRWRSSALHMGYP